MTVGIFSSMSFIGAGIQSTLHFLEAVAGLVDAPRGGVFHTKRFPYTFLQVLRDRYAHGALKGRFKSTFNLALFFIRTILELIHHCFLAVEIGMSK